MRRYCRTIVCASLAFLLVMGGTGCSGGGLVMPEQTDIPAKYLDELPSGPARLIGKVVVNTPQLTINGDSDPPELRYRGRVGLVKAGSAKFCRAMNSVEIVRMAGSDGTQWTIQFAFWNIPYGDYQISLYRIANPDWDLYWLFKYWTSGSLTVNADTSTWDAGELPYYVFGTPGTGSIEGKLLVSNFARTTVEFRVTETLLEETATSVAIGDACYWRIPFLQDDNGRMRFELRNLPPLSYQMSGNMIEENMDFADKPVEVADGTVATAVVATSTRYSFGGSADHDGWPSNSGVIKIDFDLDTEEWEGDLVLVVEKSGGATHPSQLFRHFITVRFPYGGIYDPIPVHIGPGSYTVKALLLGDSPGEARLVGEYPGAVELPPPIGVEPVYQPSTVEVILPLDLQH